MSVNRGADKLRALHCKYIINCCGAKNVFATDFTYLTFSLKDDTKQEVEHTFDPAIAMIEQAAREKNAVVVHCMAGKSRSATVVLAYLVKARRMTLKDALDFVQSKRAQVAPNAGFMKQVLQPLQVRCLTACFRS